MRWGTCLQVSSRRWGATSWATRCMARATSAEGLPGQDSGPNQHLGMLVSPRAGPNRRTALMGWAQCCEKGDGVTPRQRAPARSLRIHGRRVSVDVWACRDKRLCSLQDHRISEAMVKPSGLLWEAMDGGQHGPCGGRAAHRAALGCLGGALACRGNTGNPCGERDQGF